MLKNSLLAFLLLFAVAAAEDVPISGPDTVPLGCKVVLRSELDAEHFVWDTIVSSEHFEVFDGGRTFCFWPEKAGYYRFVLFLSNADSAGKYEFYVRVGDAEPEPNPEPGPGPKPSPNPKFPDSRMGLSQAAYESVTSHTEIPERVETSKRIANSYRGVSAQIAAGALKGNLAILAAIAQGNRDAIGSPEKIQAWRPVLGVELAKSMGTLISGGLLTTDRDFADAFIEIAVGLEAVK